jgi:hypothetical protein
MSIQVSNETNFLHLLKEAVLANTVRPRPDEEKKLTVSKLIRTSPEVEGDSQLAMILFVGIASSIYNVNSSEIIEYFGMEPEEFEFKVKKFNVHHSISKKLRPLDYMSMQEDPSPMNFDMRKFANKVKLIKTYIHLYASKHNVLIRRAA